MEFFDKFTQQHINEVLKSTFSYSDKSEFLVSAEKCNKNEEVTLLNVSGAGFEEKYALVKISDDLKTGRCQHSKNSKVLYPVFVIKNNNKESYGAFEFHPEMRHFVSPMENNAECLKIILENLAEYHALDLANSSENKKPSEYNLKNTADTIKSSHLFNDLDQTIIKQSVENLQLAVNKLFDDPSLLVRSIDSPSQTNVFINQDTNESIFLNVSSSTELVPPAYDMLLYIFVLSNEKFRQEHFENLIVYYFESLKSSLKKLGCNLADKINRKYGEHQVKTLLPLVKFKIFSSLLKLEHDQKVQEILRNIKYYIRYPFITQEDIYEVIKNKLGSNNYTLLNYSLTSLSEKNGHLGEYFHLSIKIKVQETEQELQLFAKIFTPILDLFKKDSGVGPEEKEDFFYKTIIPLYAKYGLSSLLDFAPACYLSRVSGLLVLDDLSRQGYIGLKPNIVLDYEGLNASIKNLAKLHSCSIILEEMLSEESRGLVRMDQDYEEYFEDMLKYEEGHPMKSYFDTVLNAFYLIFEKFPHITKELNLSSEELRVSIRNLFMSIFSKIKKSDKIRNVVNHGDMHVSNMLFKFGEDQLITNGILIDFQILRYVPPTCDLLLFLHITSTKQTRNNYLDILIENYYQNLIENLRKFNVDPEVVFPRKLFDQNVKFMKSAAVMTALRYSILMNLDPDFREKVFHDKEKSNYYMQGHLDELVDLSWHNEHYRNKLKGLVEDAVDLIKHGF